MKDSLTTKTPMTTEKAIEDIFRRFNFVCDGAHLVESVHVARVTVRFCLPPGSLRDISHASLCTDDNARFAVGHGHSHVRTHADNSP